MVKAPNAQVSPKRTMTPRTLNMELQAPFLFEAFLVSLYLLVLKVMMTNMAMRKMIKVNSIKTAMGPSKAVKKTTSWPMKQLKEGRDNYVNATFLQQNLYHLLFLVDGKVRVDSNRYHHYRDWQH